MLNIVDKYTVETPAIADDGIVAIEYVLMAALVAGVIVALGAAFGNLDDRLSNVINGIVA